ncbi:glycosyltransferase [Haloarchaeobius sp. HRN-SO-5]|uniref:glycosyltransferase n=1 Tax=Haloarchaeobius sp. HRN-SO-5 TaxID=3446118 RepID=UPI003EBB833C
MRIAFVALETALHADTAANRRVKGVAEHLAERGHDVVLFCAKWWTGKKAEWEHRGVVYRGLVGDVDSSRKFRYTLPMAVRKFDADVVHVAGSPPKQVSSASKAARLSDAPLVTEWYGDVASYGRRHRKALKKSDVVVTPSEMVRTTVWEHGAAEGDVEVVPNSIDFESVESVEPVEAGDVVYARRLDDGANLESLLLAMAEHRDVDWSTVVVGDGPRREAYERQAKDLRIEDRVTWLGECDREQRLAVYRGAQVFAQTARRCRFPTELLWGVAAGCIGIVEYHAESSAHELLARRDSDFERGFRTTSEQELTEAIDEAMGMEHRTVDERFAEYDHTPVLERYLQTYRDELDSADLF